MVTENTDNIVDSYYYNVEKSQIHPLISIGPNKILDMGCGTGRLGRKLLEQKKASELIGVEIFAPAAEEASRYYKHVYQGDIEQLELDYKNYFDYIICGDILEHLLDPWSMLERINFWLKKDGALICSIPNIRNWRVIKDLVLFGKWEYRDSGILDRTHLRFFTKSEFVKALNKANYEITYQKNMLWGPKKNIFNSITFRVFEEFLCSQFLFVAKN